MKHFLNLMIYLLLAIDLFGQDTKVYSVPDKQAEFVGDNGALLSYVVNNFKYPDSLVRKGFFPGRIRLQLIIEKSGTAIFKSCDGDMILCDQAKTMINQMPKWKPAEVKGKKVRSLYKLPIIICLE